MTVECVYTFYDSVACSLRELGERWEVDDSRAALLVGKGLVEVCADHAGKTGEPEACAEQADDGAGADARTVENPKKGRGSKVVGVDA